MLLGIGHAYELKKEYAKATDYYNRVKQSNVHEVVVDKAVKGLNRIAVNRIKPEGEGSRVDVIMNLLKTI